MPCYGACIKYTRSLSDLTCDTFHYAPILQKIDIKLARFTDALFSVRENHLIGFMKSVTAAVIKLNDTVLLTRRGPGEKLAGFWGFPGGKQDDGESLQECLERELFEGRGVVLTKYACQWLGMNSTEREIYRGHVQT